MWLLPSRFMAKIDLRWLRTRAERTTRLQRVRSYWVWRTRRANLEAVDGGAASGGGSRAPITGLVVFDGSQGGHLVADVTPARGADVRDFPASPKLDVR